MSRWIRALGMVLLVGCGENGKGTTQSIEQHADAPPGSRDDFPEPPPNTPPPPSMCGDQNGGGDQHIDFEAMREAKIAEKPAVEQRQAELLAARYDLSDQPAAGVAMTRGKPVQQGVRVLLPGLSWSELNDLSPDE
ncbi:MAG TPA: cytochrome B6, partial [Polyangiaceae bacterium]|nr:cytochrome B6 [Polyangiaceae bacterium]